MAASVHPQHFEPPLEGLPELAPRLRGIRLLSRELTSHLSDEERTRFARSFCFTVLESYWRHACQGAPATQARPPPCPLDIQLLPRRHLPRVELVVEAAAPLPKPLSAWLLTSLYTSMLPEKLRSTGGIFYTPPSLVERLLDLVEATGFDWSTGRVLDPSCGGGAFLVAAALRMERSLQARGVASESLLESIGQRLSGVELDSFAAWMSQVLLEIVLWPHCLRAHTRLPSLVTEADALETLTEQRERYELVVGNPPYGKLTLPPKQRERFERSLYGHANLYGVFTDLAVRLCRPAGRIAYVTPASFLGGQYFHKLRQLLREEAPPLAIDFITDRSGVFDDVLQETVLALFRRGGGGRGTGVQVHFTRPSSLERPCTATRIGRFPLPEQQTSPWLLPRERAQVPLLRSITRVPWRLADYGVEVSHQPYLKLEPHQSHLLVTRGAVLVQRTTAKEQNRRLIAAVMPERFVAAHGGVVVENHLNMIRPLRTGKGGGAQLPLDVDPSSRGAPRVSLRAIAALLNSDAVDQLFRCISGSVAVSAYELESLPVISEEAMYQLDMLIERGASREELEQFILQSYGAVS
jgi:adenine-specific DNA-methyltransferase